MLRHKLIRAETKVEDADKGLVRAIVSTEAKDRDGDIIRQEFWDLDNFMRHPVLLSSHSYGRLTSQIGEWEDMAVRSDVLEGLARYYIGEGNEEADWGFNLASKGRAAYSVGFIPDMAKAVKLGHGDEWGGFEFKGQELLEGSHVTIPSNHDALQRLKGVDLHPVVAEIVDEALGEDGAHVPLAELQVLIASAETRLKVDLSEFILKLIDDQIVILRTELAIPVDNTVKEKPDLSEKVKRAIAEVLQHA